MDLPDVIRTTFACRQFTDEPMSDEALHRILDIARFAPSGGNRQGHRVIVVKDRDIRRQLADLCRPTMAVYLAQVKAGEAPWNTVNPTSVDAVSAAQQKVNFPLLDELPDVPAVLVVCVDLSVVASFDQHLDRVGVISGASVYPFVWNILLAARNDGYGGALTTFLAGQEAEAQAILGLPAHVAVCALLPLGRPAKQLTKLTRLPVEAFTTVDRYDGEPFTA